MDSFAGLAFLCLALFLGYGHARPSSSLFEEAARIDAAATDPNDDKSDSVPIEPRFGSPNAPPPEQGFLPPPHQQATQPLQQFINNPDARNLSINGTNGNIPNARGGYGGYDGGGGYGGGGYGGGYGGYGGGYGFAPGLLFGEEKGFFQGPPPEIICGQMGGEGAPYWVLEQCRQMGIPISDNLGAIARRKYGYGGGGGLAGGGFDGGFGGGIIGRSSKPHKTGHHLEEKRIENDSSAAHHQKENDDFSDDAKFRR